MKTILKIFIAIIILACSIYVDDLQRGAGILAGLVIACFGSFIGDRTDRHEEWRDFFALIGCAIYFIFLIGVANGIHIIEQENGVVIRSAWYTHIIDKGSIKTKNLRAYYTDRNEVKEDEFYFVYHADSTVSVYNVTGKIVTVPVTFTINHKDWGRGELDYISVDNNLAYDMRGRVIEDGYTPYVLDQTPDYNTTIP